MDSSPIGQTGMDREPAFVPGLLLNERFYAELVRPILADAFPSLRYSAALIGPGSDVLGYDTPRSTDHEWGPRLLLFLSGEDHANHAAAIRSDLSHRLPPTFMGYSTHFGPPGPDGVQMMAPNNGEPTTHKVELHSPAVLTSWLGFDPFGEIAVTDWLLVPQQTLLEVTAGRVYHDGLGMLEPMRAALAYYPRAVWLYLLASQWSRISEVEAFLGRAGEVGDEVGSALVAAALARDLMGLCFLMERRYAPYSKWFGTAFAELSCAPRLMPLFKRVLQSETWPNREDALVAAYEAAAELHNALGITAPLDSRTRSYYSRPFQVFFADRFSEAIAATIADSDVRGILDRAGPIGSIDQLSDLAHPEQTAKLRSLYC